MLIRGLPPPEFRACEPSHQYLERRRMSKKQVRTCCETIGSRLHDDNQVAFSRLPQFGTFSKEIERCAEWPDDRSDLTRRLADVVADHDRVVLADDLPEIARSSKMVVQATVGHEEHLPTRLLTVEHPADKQSSFADQVSAQLEHKFGVRQRNLGSIDNSAQIFSNRREVQRLRRP